MWKLAALKKMDIKNKNLHSFVASCFP